MRKKSILKKTWIERGTGPGPCKLKYIYNRAAVQNDFVTVTLWNNHQSGIARQNRIASTKIRIWGQNNYPRWSAPVAWRNENPLVMRKSDGEGGGLSAPPKKMRKQMSDAEKMAVELSKMSFSFEPERKFRVENNKLIFLNKFQSEKCTWRDKRTDPTYCKNADLKFQAQLPDRAYLTRFSVRCSTCYDCAAGVHLYCAHCDDILTGSIAGPGGKITDHLITIRHVYQQTGILKDMFEKGTASDDDKTKAREYAAKLDEWSDRIRYPVCNAIRRIHFEELLRQIYDHLGEPMPSVWVSLITARNPHDKSVRCSTVTLNQFAAQQSMQNTKCIDFSR